ncbi:MAG: hypothetical protein A2Z17_06875 [Gammaproteobacteria bacterium RBG_16_66_13]|nr:MAG: hypothetical protein A2Z17_06875 [Gammaproteobacteria bacterium RBG_16_66_13]
MAPASSSAARNGNAIDMMGWDGCDFILEVGDIAATGTLNAKVQRDDNSSFTSATDIVGAAITALGASDDNKVVIISVCEPSERYLRIVVTAATAASISGVTAVRWRRHGGLPPTQEAAEVVVVAPGG